MILLKDILTNQVYLFNNHELCDKKIYNQELLLLYKYKNSDFTLIKDLSSGELFKVNKIDLAAHEIPDRMIGHILREFQIKGLKEV